MTDVDRWVSAEYQRLAEIIQDYDHHLFLEFIPVAARQTQTDKTQCYRIVDDRNNKIVLFASELDNPTEILARLWSMDSARGNVLGRLDAHNAAVQALKLKEQLDEQEAVKDFAAFVFKNEKNYWTHAGRKRDAEFRDLGPVRSHIT